MGSANRVEELETRVKELEATVTGLTDELLECKERLTTLEEEVDPAMDTVEKRPSTPSEKADRTNIDGNESMDSAASESDEIIVA